MEPLEVRMADFDFSSLMQNPMFMAGLQGLLSRPQDRGQAMLKGAMSAQQMAGTQQQQQLNALKLQQAQNAASFNPMDYMQTTPNAGTATPDMQAQQAQQPPMPATLGGVLGGNGSPMMQPSPQAIQGTPIPQPTPGTPTGRVDQMALLQGGMQAGMQPAEVAQLANIMDPTRAAQMAAASKLAEPYTLSPGQSRMVGNQTLGQNTNAPMTSPVSVIDQLTKARDAAVASGDVQKAAQYDAALQKASGSAEQDTRAQMLDLAKQRLNGDPEMIEKTAQGIANGQLAPLSGFSMKTPQGQAVMARVLELNPTYDQKTYATSQKSANDFATGKNGNTVRSLNVAIDHLGTLNELAGALNNGDLQAVNKIGNAVATQTGKPAPTNFNTAKSIVADEVVKAIVGAGGALADREQAASMINAASSPQQLQGAIQTYQKLLGGQLGGMQRQYEQGTGRKDFDRFLSPATKSILGMDSPTGGGSKAIVRTGTANGRKVVQYSDGTTAYAD